MPDPSQDPTPDVAQLDLPFVEAKQDEILRSMSSGLQAWLPPSWWFPARRSARIIVARVQFYPADMAREARATDQDALAIPLFLACADTGWDPFGDGGKRADNIFDRAAGMKSPPVEPGPSEQFAHAMAKTGAGTLETQGTLLPPCQVSRSIGGRDDMFLLGAATSWFLSAETPILGPGEISAAGLPGPRAMGGVRRSCLVLERVGVR